ncbi:5-methylcytosine restriction system specificity protein McrC [Variovorax sp. RB3P1]|uniref:5-methylcytosine restriction system specificity protein McrC n=1 Tax=Variovorax sp. RB3P1 TaxID=3443732 RepID=UPI003F46B133
MLSQASWLDIFIHQFCKQLVEQARRGVTKRYRIEEDDLDSVQGNLVIHEQVRRNFIHKEHLACEFDELDENHELNQLLKLALERMSRLARHERQQPLQKGACHAAAPVRLQHAAPGADEGREGRVVGLAFVPEARVQAADELTLCAHGQQAVQFVQRVGLAHVVPGVGVAEDGLAGLVLGDALAPAGESALPVGLGGTLRIENSGDGIPRVRGTGFKHGGPWLDK